MDHFKLIRPEHLNHYGYLFGGYLLQWVDEAAYITAIMDLPGNNFVTLALDRVEFRKSMREGTIFKFAITRAKVGRTSVTYNVQVFDKSDDPVSADSLFSTNITFVSVDEQGAKKPITLEKA